MLAEWRIQALPSAAQHPRATQHSTSGQHLASLIGHRAQEFGATVWWCALANHRYIRRLKLCQVQHSSAIHWEDAWPTIELTEENYKVKEQDAVLVLQPTENKPKRH